MGFLRLLIKHIFIYPPTPTPVLQHICVGESGQHWLRKWLVAYSALGHYLKKMMGYCELDPKEQTSVKLKSKYKTFYSRNASVNIVGEIAAILSRGAMS